jgi:hypothetical protein
MNDISEASDLRNESNEWKETAWSFRAAYENSRAFVSRELREHPKITVSVIIALLLIIYIERHEIQPILLFLRVYAGGALIAILAAFGIWAVLRKRSVRVRTFGGAFAVTTFALLALFGSSVHEYVAQYFRYKTLEYWGQIVDIKELPRTDHERILPLRGVYTLARERMNETEEPSIPALVREGTEYRWTMAVQPAREWSRLMHPIEEIISISASESSPDMSRRKPAKAYFTTGENLFFSRNTDTCVRRAFGPWRSINYEPAEVFYMKNDAGKWVQAVSLIKWTGLLFPWPEFGGVQVIEEGGTNMLGRVFLGCGTWIPPEEIGRHAYLKGQNLMPFSVTRFMAGSLRFQKGFFAPLPLSRVGDIRIADMPGDLNEQPFTLFFRLNPADEGKLYQYFALEPSDPDKQGLSTSFFAPADGIGSMYAYRHFDLNEAPLGPTAVADQVRASRKHYDWERNIPVEVRPYIHDIADSSGNIAPRFGWMVTTVTIKERKEGEPTEFTSGSDPEISVVDAYRGRVVWLNGYRPEEWPDQLRQSLGSLWAAKD